MTSQGKDKVIPKETTKEVPEPGITGQTAPPVPQMTFDQSLSILIQGCNKGQKNGAFDYKESALVGQAIDLIQTQAQQAQAQQQKSNK